MTKLMIVDGPTGQKFHLGFLRLVDLYGMYCALGPRFLNRNIRYGLGENKAVNRAISGTLKKIVIDKTEQSSVFAFDHNGITLFAENIEYLDGEGQCRLTSPLLLNGAQTVTTVKAFLDKNKDNPKLQDGRDTFESIRVLCKVITNADQDFVTRVTINNNRQNPVEPWNLHANDIIQLEIHDKLRCDVGVYYERQENAFDQLSLEDLEDYGIKTDTKAIKMLKLTQTFLLTDGSINKLSEMKRVFEDSKVYNQVFRPERLNADSRHILLCYKVHIRLPKLATAILQRGQNKYWFISRCRNLLWALICQGLLNHDDLENLSELYGKSMILSVAYVNELTTIATARVRPLLSDLMNDPDYAKKVAEENLSFLRTDAAFEKCMRFANKRWGWEQKRLG